MHVLCSSTANPRRGQHHRGLPGGSPVIPVPPILQQPLRKSSWNALPLRLSNEFPVPGDAIDHLVAVEHGGNTINLDHIVDTRKRKKKRKKKKKKLPVFEVVGKPCRNRNGNFKPRKLNTRSHTADSRRPEEYLDMQPAKADSLADSQARSDLSASVLQNSWPIMFDEDDYSV